MLCKALLVDKFFNSKRRSFLKFIMSSRKKRKFDTEAPIGECFGEVIAELDLEIALRRRLAETIDSRITWALVLQESLKKGGNGSTTSFMEAAFDAISAIEMPINVLFTREICPKIAPVALNHVQPIRIPRPPPKQKAARKPNANFLYIRSADLEPPYDDNHVRIYLLRCPTCLRKAFTSLQGLLNHARISHGLEWGTHDECVRACAVMDSELDVDLGIEVGLGPSGILPGLRSLFQMAVGAHQAIDSATEADVKSDKAGGKAEPPSASSHLVRTLGLHEDTPALAPFLGKQAARRGIKLWGNGDEFVDVDGVGDDEAHNLKGLPTCSMEGEATIRPTNSQRIWRMPFAHRNDSEPEAPGKVQEMGPVANTEPDLTHISSTTPEPFKTADDRHPAPAAGSINMITPTGSRFHFAARVIVIDRSFWIPPEKRPESNKVHTHKWMISVDSPSYSHHITTILKKLTVSSLSDPSGSPLTTTSPPFVAVGTTKEPFLARLELHFSGAPGPNGEVTDQTMVLEHWVELDLMKSSTPVVGDEQVVDIELDKRTILLPIQKGYTPIGAKVLWSQSAETLQVKDGFSKADHIQAHGDILNNIVRKFPMTLNEVKSGRQAQPQVPYKLVSTAQFKSFVPGRRKAIEWCRARAIRDAFTRAIRDPRFTAQSPIPLTTADVYSWLTEEGHFIRPDDATEPKKKHNDTSTKDEYAQTWCSTCGLGFHSHVVASAVNAEHTQLPSKAVKMEAGVKSEDGQPQQEYTRTFPNPCNIAPQVTKIPLVNVYTRVPPTPSAQSIPPVQKLEMRITSFRASDLVAASDPKLTVAVHSMVRALDLQTFASPSHNGKTLHPLDGFGTDKHQVEAHLASRALLAIVANRFMRKLVEGGLDVVKRDKAASTVSSGSVIKKRRRNAKENMAARTVLTPTHILSSVISHARDPHSQGSVLDVAMFECIAKLGVPFTPKGLLPIAAATQGQPPEPVISVKVEEF
ncbi:hypothetical protein D9615_004461 [Tricholomella constricta]|uniref:YEATS domain-containing protein n=1 Tax=Tricholomella constricta TaxID=117010 RepID=A0A8H5HEU5_9AGAR|nr:hypothetical protein D9615_004461 [Tricholomella constricta]